MANPKPLRPFTMTRQRALALKAHGTSLALVELRELRQRLDLAAGQAAALRAVCATLCAKYGDRAMIEQLTNAELEHALNAYWLTEHAQRVEILERPANPTRA